MVTSIDIWDGMDTISHAPITRALTPPSDLANLDFSQALIISSSLNGLNVQPSVTRPTLI